MNTSQLLNIGKELAYNSGKIMKSHFEIGIEKEWKEDSTPVTIADKKINSLVIKTIKESFPNHSILGEEESTEINSEYVWVCDPIDGTFPYSHGVPTSVFSLALTKEGESIFGIVYDPYLDRMFWGLKNKGSFLNKERINVSKIDNLSKSVIDVETWIRSPYYIEGIESALDKKGALVTGICSTVYPGALVAAGAFSAQIFSGSTPWDVAALKIIVEEAGGKVTDLLGREQRYDRPIKGALSSNGLVHKELLSLIKPLLS